MAEITRYIKHRRDTAANWTANNTILKAGQIGIETDLLPAAPKWKIGDGTTAWTALAYSNTKDTVLTVFVASTNTAIAPTDTVLEALQKLQAQINASIGF